MHYILDLAWRDHRALWLNDEAIAFHHIIHFFWAGDSYKPFLLVLIRVLLNTLIRLYHNRVWLHNRLVLKNSHFRRIWAWFYGIIPLSWRSSPRSNHLQRSSIALFALDLYFGDLAVKRIKRPMFVGRTKVQTFIHFTFHLVKCELLHGLFPLFFGNRAFIFHDDHASIIFWVWTFDRIWFWMSIQCFVIVIFQIHSGSILALERA